MKDYIKSIVMFSTRLAENYTYIIQLNILWGYLMKVIKLVMKFMSLF